MTADERGRATATIASSGEVRDYLIRREEYRASAADQEAEMRERAGDAAGAEACRAVARNIRRRLAEGWCPT